MKKEQLPELPYRIALVIWEDSYEPQEEKQDPKYYDDPENREYFAANVGWIIKDDDFGIVMAFSYLHDEDIEKPLVIPRSAVRHTEYLK